MQTLVDLFYRPPVGHMLGSITEAIYADGFKDGAVAAIAAFGVSYLILNIVHNLIVGK